MFAGAITGMTESIMITPFELVKVRLQSMDKLTKYTNSYHAVQTIVKTEGVLSLWRGLESTLWRNGSWNAAYFGCIDVVRSNVSQYLNPVGITNRESQHFIAGTIGGSIGACFSTPIDVAKSRIQNSMKWGSSSSSSSSSSRSSGSSGSSSGGSGRTRIAVKVPWTLPTLLSIGQKEGIVGLYRGFVPKLLRLGPGGGLLLVTFETTKSCIENTIL